MLDIDKTIKRIKFQDDLSLGACADLKRIQEYFKSMQSELETLRAERKAMMEQEPAVFMKFDASGEFINCRLNGKGMIFDCDASYVGYFAKPMLVQPSPAVADPDIDSITGILADRFKGRKLPSNPISEIMEPNDIVEQPDIEGEKK